MQTKVLSSCKERIKNILTSRPVDRVGILDLDIEFYPVRDGTQKVDKNISNGVYSSYTPRAGTNTDGSLKESDKFFIFAFNGPFQNMSSGLGLENALAMFVQEPRHTLLKFVDYQERIAADYKRLKDEGIRFDGIWMWEDIAYDKGLYFSIEKYRNQLLGIHKDIADFFASEELAVFFHCDGNIESLIPMLAAVNVKALHPAQEICNPHLLEIKSIFKGIMTFIGGVGLHRLGQEKGELLEYIQRLKEGGNYIFSFDGPIPDDFDKKEYDNIIKNIEAEGT